jgi:DNA-binding NtrC family response regulator
MHKAKTNLLIVDDDRNFSSSVRDYLLQPGGYEVYLAHTGKDCLDLCTSTQMNIVLLDQKLPDLEGAELCGSILDRNSQTKIIFTTAFPNFDNAVKAVRAGAFDYLSKPFELDELDLVLNHAVRTLDLEKVEQFQNYRADVESAENVLVGQSAGIREIMRLIGLAATTDAPVLITGETGTGKNVAARAVHFSGPLRHEPFIGINCAALPEQLIEAELFGHEKGAFTGAVGLKKGMFEVAEGGTLFLDEIGELPIGLQAKLLGVLDDGTFRRLGGTTLHHARVRIIAATSVDIEKAIRERNFREDLFYRLGVIKMHLPPLRERKDDLAELCGYLIGRTTKGRGKRLADGELGTLAQYDWPGNVRELRNVLERAIILQPGEDLRPSEFLRMPGAKEARLPRVRAGAPSTGPLKTLDEVEKHHILCALEEHGGNFSRAARAVGISLTTLKRKLQKYRINK